MRWKTLHSFYTSDEWKDLKHVLMLERGDTCGCGCGKLFGGIWDCIPHHKIELTLANVNDYTISLNPSNILLVRHGCHNRIHVRFGSSCRKVYLVWGAPCAGKATFVKGAAEDDDLILNIDLLWPAVCLAGKPKRIASDVFALRDRLLDRIATRSGYWRAAWVVGTYPLKGERERVAGRLGAEEIHIDTDFDTCLKRSEGDTKIQQWIKEYFDKVQA